MKVVYILLFVSLNAFANISAQENTQDVSSSIVTNEDPILIAKPKSSSISGLKIVMCESEKYGKHIYIVSDMYMKKKINFYTMAGAKVHSVSTVGSPIYLSKMQKGIYKVKITEGDKTEVQHILVN